MALGLGDPSDQSDIDAKSEDTVFFLTANGFMPRNKLQYIDILDLSGPAILSLLATF